MSNQHVEFSLLHTLSVNVSRQYMHVVIISKTSLVVLGSIPSLTSDTPRPLPMCPPSIVPLSPYIKHPTVLSQV